MGPVLKWTLQVSSSRSDGVLVLSLAGRLSSILANTLGMALADAIEQRDVRLVLDLEGVDYVSSAALRSIESAAARCGALGGGLILCGVAPAVRVAVDMAGLAGLAIESSRKAAIRRSRGGLDPA